MAVLFPKVESLVVHGFGKIFNKEDLEIDLSQKLNIILGGNGLGKTTLLQCVIYSLTGGMDDNNIEENKTFRWNHTYFKGRIEDDAYVIVDFFLGSTRITAKRGFNSSRVLECILISAENIHQNMPYDQAICEFGNYNSVEDFSFIVNRLLYLSENRRSLLWDYDAQIRTLMIISNEFVSEYEYRSLRKRIKEKDSNKRKIHWDIGRIEKYKDGMSSDKTKTETTAKKEHSDFLSQKKDLLGTLQQLTDSSKQLYNKIRDDEDSRNNLVKIITELSDHIHKAEAAYMETLLLEYDEEHSLLFSKTLKNGYCPACDQKSKKLKGIIVGRIKHGECLICGEPLPNHKNLNIDFDLDSLNSQLQEKIIARNALDVRINQNNNKRTQIEEDVSQIRDKLSELDYDYSDDLSDTEDDDLKEENFYNENYINLCQKEKELEFEIMQLTKKADDIYDYFKVNFQNRYDQLFKIYKSLAYKFLGVPVELKYIKSNAKFVDMNYLVPRFDETDRDSPNTCSEAQRFFLDIAFRMSVVTLNRSVSNNDASFICETPENALDVSYINNVVKMFLAFIEKGGSLILTSNLQLLGIAQFLAKEAKSNRISIEIFDLLKYGKLSEIQNQSEQLKEIRDKIIGEAKK